MEKVSCAAANKLNNKFSLEEEAAARGVGCHFKMGRRKGGYKVLEFVSESERSLFRSFSPIGNRARRTRERATTLRDRQPSLSVVTFA